MSRQYGLMKLSEIYSVLVYLHYGVITVWHHCIQNDLISSFSAMLLMHLQIFVNFHVDRQTDRCKNLEKSSLFVT